jgi:SAM-dependent methyltransferase
MKKWILYAAALTTVAFACDSDEAPRAPAGERGASSREMPHENDTEPLIPAGRIEPRVEPPHEVPLDDQDAPAERTPDVVYVPTPQPVVNKMLEVAKVKPGEVVYDLGCGDGRIVVTAAKRYGVRAYGFDIDPARVAEARENARKSGVSELVTIEQADVFELDLSPADVVTLYLLPELNVRLIPQLEKLEPGSRVVSHDYDMQGVKPAPGAPHPTQGHRTKAQYFPVQRPAREGGVSASTRPSMPLP